MKLGLLVITRGEHTSNPPTAKVRLLNMNKLKTASIPGDPVITNNNEQSKTSNF